MFQIYAGLGKRDEAFAWLEKAWQQRNVGMLDLKGTPFYPDSVRADPRFTASASGCHGLTNCRKSLAGPQTSCVMMVGWSSRMIVAVGINSACQLIMLTVILMTVVLFSKSDS